MKLELGRIYACIAGDYRYGSTVTVTLNDDDTVTVERRESGAVGGMDGPGGAYDAGVYFSRTIEKPTPRKVIDTVWESFDVTIREYGKPTKNFTWSVRGYRAKGLSQAKAREALAAARG